MKKLWIAFVGVACLLGTCYGIYTLQELSTVLRPAPSTICCETPSDWGYTYQDVELNTGDITLRGWYIPPQNGIAIILLHGYWSNRLQAAPVAQILAAESYGVLLYDMRGHGESNARWRSRGWQDVADVGAALDFLAQQSEVEHIGIWGHSIGGQVALRAAAQYPQIEAVIADGAARATADDVTMFPINSLRTRLRYLHFQVLDYGAALWLNTNIPESVLESIPTISPRPVLLIVGGKYDWERDRVTGYFEVAQEPKTLWIVPEGGHGGLYELDPDGYTAQVLQFFENTLQS